LFAYVRHIDENLIGKKLDTHHTPEAHGVANNIFEDVQLQDMPTSLKGGLDGLRDGSVYSLLFEPREIIVPFAGTGNPMSQGFAAFMQPTFRFFMPMDSVGNSTHIRVYRTNEIDADGIDASSMQGGAYRFLCDLPIPQDGSDIVWTDGDDNFGFDVSQTPREPLPRTFVSSSVLIGGEMNSYNLFGVGLFPNNTAVFGAAFGRLFAVDSSRNILMASMPVGMSGLQGTADIPNMYRLYVAANNWVRIKEPITAVFGYGSQLVIFTQRKTYIVSNANNPNADGTFRNAPQEISGHIGTMFPNAICVFNEVLYFIDSDGDISQIRGSECKKSGAPIKFFKSIADMVETPETILRRFNAPKAMTVRDKMIFVWNDGMDFRNFQLYCFVNRPHEQLDGWFTYDRYPDTGIRKGQIENYGSVWYGEEFYGGGWNIVGQNVAFASGNEVWAMGMHGAFRQQQDFRISQLFNRSSYEDIYFGDEPDNRPIMPPNFGGGTGITQ
jgi:hypothetical protein